MYEHELSRNKFMMLDEFVKSHFFNLLKLLMLLRLIKREEISVFSKQYLYRKVSCTHYRSLLSEKYVHIYTYLKYTEHRVVEV